MTAISKKHRAGNPDLQEFLVKDIEGWLYHNMA